MFGVVFPLLIGALAHDLLLLPGRSHLPGEGSTGAQGSDVAGLGPAVGSLPVCAEYPEQRNIEPPNPP